MDKAIENNNDNFTRLQGPKVREYIIRNLNILLTDSENQFPPAWKMGDITISYNRKDEDTVVIGLTINDLRFLSQAYFYSIFAYMVKYLAARSGASTFKINLKVDKFYGIDRNYNASSAQSFTFTLEQFITDYSSIVDKLEIEGEGTREFPYEIGDRYALAAMVPDNWMFRMDDQIYVNKGGSREKVISL